MKMINESNYDQALFKLNEILKIEPNNTNALNNKGGILIKTGNFSDAITNFNLILENNQNNTQALNNKAIALYHQELYVQSLRSFYKSLVIDPSNEITFNNTKNVIEKLYWIDESNNGYGIISLRDSNGNLLHYSKIFEIRVQPPLGYIFLEKNGSLNEYEIDGKNVTILQHKGNYTLDKTQFVGRTDVYLTIDSISIIVVELLLNGFIANQGDTIEYEIVIFNPPF